MLHSFRKWREDYVSKSPAARTRGSLLRVPCALLSLVRFCCFSLLSGASCATVTAERIHLVETNLWKPWPRNPRGKNDFLSMASQQLGWPSSGHVPIHPMDQSLLLEDEVLWWVTSFFKAWQGRVGKGTWSIMIHDSFITPQRMGTR